MVNLIIIGEETNLVKKIRSKKFNFIRFTKFTFSNDNIIYQLDHEDNFNNVNIVADLSVNIHENLWGLLITLDFLKKKAIKVKKIVFPYFPYSRSNHKHRHITSGLFTLIKYLNEYEIERIITIDPHFNGQDISSKNNINTIEQKTVFDFLIKESINGKNNCLIIGPDNGSKRRIKILREEYELDGFCMDKCRLGHENKVEVKTTNIQNNKISQANRIMIFDDEICSGSTIKNTINQIKKINSKVFIDLFITHNFLKTIDNYIFPNINNLYTTNSVENHITNIKIKKIDVSKYIEEELYA
jgi:phosphoribosylpyrophosphate synthetase